MAHSDRKSPDRTTILDANRSVHSALAVSGEYDRSPHFREENQRKVRAILKGLLAPNNTRFDKVLDMGCGTGFIIRLVQDLADEVHGVDITDAMLERVDTSSGNVFLHNAEAETTPFPGDTFSLVTSYSFLDHLEDHKPVLQEAFRVLKPGGVFYSDLNPNRHFSQIMLNLEKSPTPNMPELVGREITGMLHNGEYYESNFGIAAEDLLNAEPMKTLDHGFDPDSLIADAQDIGYSEARYEYDWYLGQATMLHQHSAEKASEVESYLRMVLPASRGLFKYIRIFLRK